MQHFESWLSSGGWRVSAMFWRLVALTAIFGVIHAPAATNTVERPGWRLVWSDEFNQTNGSGVDPAKWRYDTGGLGWGNKELEYYTLRTNNCRIEDGHLVIEAQREEFDGQHYTSARLLTLDKA